MHNTNVPNFHPWYLHLISAKVSDKKPPRPSCWLHLLTDTELLLIQASLESDISHFVPLANHQLTDDIRATILRQRFTPPPGWAPPYRLLSNTKRRVPPFVFNTIEFPTLSYSVLEDSVYCAECVAFSLGNAVLVRRPLTNWSNAKKQVDAHVMTQEHKTCVVKAAQFLQYYDQKVQPIGSVSVLWTSIGKCCFGYMYFFRKQIYQTWLWSYKSRLEYKWSPLVNKKGKCCE